MTEADELRQVAERFERFERLFLAQIRDDLEAAAARQVLGRTDRVAAQLMQATATAQRLHDTVESPQDAAGEALAAVRVLHAEMIRLLSYVALGLLVLVIVAFVFIVST